MNVRLISAKSWPRGPRHVTQVRSSLLCLRRQVAKLASGMLYSWSLLRNNNTAIYLQMFTSSYGSRRFGAWDRRSPTEGFFHPYLLFSRPVCLGYYEKSRDICVFWSDKPINNFNVSSVILECLYAHIRWENTHIGWSRTCSIGFIFSYKIIVRVIYCGVFKERQARHLPRAPFVTVMCKVAYLAFRGAQQQLQCISGLLCFQRGPQQQL